MSLSPREARRLAEHVLDDQSGEAVASGDATAAEVARALPERIGQHRIRRLIAAGGMGVVYEAEQETPRRTVAIKVMSRQFAARGRAAMRRFEYEAQILAGMDHPGIAKVHEAGTWDDGTGGVPYFVMEFIPSARNIIDFADVHGLSTTERLQLFAKVCDAVHYGHQKGIIHRDLKPANIMVPEAHGDAGDEPPQPKVIDFGVARSADTDVSVTTMHTAPGEIIGTLQYMSPEQCDGDPHAIDLRSDVYALGIVLYELLCGRLPYDLSNTPIPRATRIVQEQEPGRPSLISSALKGNLEAILLRAIAKNPADRYQSAADFGRDVRRHLAGEPIEARQPGTWNRVVRSVARHPVRVTGAACLTILLLTLAATWASTWFVSMRPHRLELQPDGREAWLMSLGGSVLHKWTAGADGYIRFAQLTSDERTGQWLAILGFTQRGDSHWRGALCAFDVDSDLEEPIWEERITEADLISGIDPTATPIAGFGVAWGMIEDIFPEVPGTEIIAGSSHEPSSLGAIAIYDTAGELLYRVWNDGGTGGGYWMKEKRQLVVTGLNAEVYWGDRGHPGVDGHPIIVYALEPRLGYDGRSWTTPSPIGSLETVAWYQCLLPPIASGLVSARILSRPLPGYNPGSFVTLDLHLADQKSSISWVLDAAGQEVPGTRSPNNYWRANEPHEIEFFHLGDLPPVVIEQQQD